MTLRERRTAAAYAIRDTMQTRNAWDMADAALEAADAVMFNDAATVRVARQMYALQSSMSISPVAWDEQIPRIQNFWKRNALKVIAAVKDGSETECNSDETNCCE